MTAGLFEIYFILFYLLCFCNEWEIIIMINFSVKKVQGTYHRRLFLFFNMFFLSIMDTLWLVQNRCIKSITNISFYHPSEAATGCVYKKATLKSFAKLTGKFPHRTPVQVFFREFCEIFKNVFLKSALSGLRQFLTIECPLNMMERDFYFTSKALFVL